MKSILITGVAGFVGSRFADWVVENKPEYTVVGIDNLSGGYIENVNDKVIFHKMDVSYDNLKPLFEEHRFEYVFHFAAYAAEGLSPFIRKFNYDNNIGATVNIINECINYDVKRLVYTSSMSVYGRGKGEGVRFDENDRQAPIDPYAISKYACEMDIEVAGEQHGLDWCIIRPHNIYGMKQCIWDKYRNVIGIWMNNILNDRPITIYGDGTQTRAFSYIDDNLEPFWNAAVSEKCSKQIINVGGTEGTTIQECADILMDITGAKDIVYLEKRHEVHYAVPSYKKSVELLGYKQTTQLPEGMAKMWEWAQQQPKREQFIWPAYEINKGIYSYWKLK